MFVTMIVENRQFATNEPVEVQGKLPIISKEFIEYTPIY